MAARPSGVCAVLCCPVLLIRNHALAIGSSVLTLIPLSIISSIIVLLKNTDTVFGIIVLLHILLNNTFIDSIDIAFYGLLKYYIILYGTVRLWIWVYLGLQYSYNDAPLLTFSITQVCPPRLQL